MFNSNQFQELRLSCNLYNSIVASYRHIILTTYKSDQQNETPIKFTFDRR